MWTAVWMSGVVAGDGGACGNDASGGLQTKWASSTTAATATASAASPGVGGTGGRVATRMSSDLDDLSIDADDADDRYREEHEPTCRGRTLQFLESNPLQVALYVMVLLDAIVVISEILLDLHAMRSQYREATSDLLEAMNFIKQSFSSDLEGYEGDNIQYVLSTLRTKHALLSPSNFSQQHVTHHPGRQDAHPHRLQSTYVIGHKSLPRDASDDQVTNSIDLGSVKSTADGELASNQKPRSGKRIRRHSSVIGDYSRSGADESDGGGGGGKFNKSLMQYVDVSKATKMAATERKDAVRQSTRIEDDALEIDLKTINSDRTINATGSGTGPAPGTGTVFYADDDSNLSEEDSVEKSDSFRNDSVKYYKDYSYSEKLLKIAHILHYVGIGILGFFVIQVSLKVFGMGSDFFKKKFEIFDAIIVLTSFGLDLVFIEGIAGDQTEEAIALLIIFLLWRILRIVNGIMITSKKRQEFRIQILKRARRRAQKKIEYLEDDKNWKEREITNLRRLCSERGAHDDDIAACKPRRRTIFQKMDTSVGLSTIASLSLGVSMSMTGTGRTLIKTLGAGVAAAAAAGSSSLGPRMTTDRRRSFNQLFPLLPGAQGGASGDRSRRASFVDILQYSRTVDLRAATEKEGHTPHDRRSLRAVFLDGDPGRRHADDAGKLNGYSCSSSSSSSSKRRNSAVDKTDEKGKLDATDQGERSLFGKAQRTDEVSGQSFRSQIPEVTIHAPDDSCRAPLEQTTTTTMTSPNAEADDRRSRVVISPGESAELLLGCKSVPKISLSLPQISLGQDDLDLDSSNGSLLDSKELVVSCTDASPGDVTRFKCNDVSRTSTSSANCNATQMKPNDNKIMTVGSPVSAVSQIGNSSPIGRGDHNETDGINTNTRSLTLRNPTTDDFTVLIVSPKGGARNPFGLSNGDSCKKQTVSSLSGKQSVLDAQGTSILVSTSQPHLGNSPSSPATLDHNTTHSNSIPVCSVGNSTSGRPPLLRAVGLVWSRSQELHPKDRSHDSLSANKMSLATRRRSAQCVCSKRHTVENLSK